MMKPNLRSFVSPQIRHTEAYSYLGHIVYLMAGGITMPLSNNKDASRIDNIVYFIDLMGAKPSYFRSGYDYDE